ncbi:hypothetical protein XENTR_v10014368, partial [Xenopus tropicalis]
NYVFIYTCAEVWYVNVFNHCIPGSVTPPFLPNWRGPSVYDRKRLHRQPGLSYFDYLGSLYIFVFLIVILKSLKLKNEGLPFIYS